MSSRPRLPVRTLDPETAHERHSRMFQIRQGYAAGRKPVRPSSRAELDILKERKRFIHATDVDPSTLSWEDALALKYYETLFREFCVVNLKHYKHGAIALRWRTETEVLAGTAHLTCASMRCRYHVPPEKDEDLDPESMEPLVETTLTEYEVPFSYQEENEKKTALVKVVLCPECGEKLLYGRKKDKELNRERERSSAGQEVRREDDDDDGRGADRGASRAGEEDDSFTPSLPPDLAEERHRSRRRSSVEHQPSRRRSASPRRRLK